jgi:hypothetical protein
MGAHFNILCQAVYSMYIHKSITIQGYIKPDLDLDFTSEKNRFRILIRPKASNIPQSWKQDNNVLIRKDNKMSVCFLNSKQKKYWVKIYNRKIVFCKVSSILSEVGSTVSGSDQKVQILIPGTDERLAT